MEKHVRSFYAMEYVNLIGNRILKIWVTPEYIFGAKVKGFTSESTQVSLVDDSSLVLDYNIRNNPQNYADQKEEIKYAEINFIEIKPNDFININKSNFVK